MVTRGAARRACEALASVAAAWAIAVHLTGGIVLSIGELAVTSRNPLNAWIVAAAAGILALALSFPRPRRALAEDADVWRRRALNARARARAHASHLPAALVAVVAAGALVLDWAAARPLWLDEQMVALNVRDRPAADLVGALWLEQSAPFGWLVLQRAVYVALGDGERALRLLPMLMAVATLAAAWWVGRRWLGAAGATVLVVLFAFGEWVLYYALELKPYSGDVFFALWLPALAAWALEAPDARGRLRRQALWWTGAALAQWVSNGAMLVAPGCALVLCLATWRLAGWPASWRFASLGVVWLASFALNYVVTLRHALASDFLGDYWAFALRPEGAGPLGTVAWLVAALEPLALKPAGTEWGLLLWAAAAAGLVAGAPRPLAWLMATVPLSAFVLASLQLVPLFERLSLWIVPSLYVAVALLADRALRRPATPLPLAWRQRGLAGIAVVAVALVGADVVRRGAGEMRRTTGSNHALDDRRGVAWLLQQGRPGDVVLTTRLALPAVWWYGGVDLGAPGGSRLADGSPVMEVAYRAPGEACDEASLARALRGRDRALVYFGFRFDDVPAGFDGLLIDRLLELGTVRAVETFASTGRAVVVDLGVPTGGSWEFPLTLGEADDADDDVPPAGCLDVRPARRW